MPGEQDANLELDPSSNSTLDEAQDMPEGNGSADAGSSTAKEGDTNDDVSTLSVVRDVVNGSQKTDAAASPADGAETGEVAGDKLPKEVDDENFSDAPFNKHPRFKKLIEQRNAAREGATRYEAVEKFLAENNLDGNEAFNGLAAIAKAKSDPVACWQEIKPWVQKLLIAAGEVLPDDLAARVQRGELSHDDAIALSRAHSRVQSVEARTTFQQQQAERRAQEQQRQAVQDTVAAWENDRTVKDPNFSAKYPLMLEKLKVLQFDEGVPNTLRGVQEQLDRAYKSANDAFRPPAVAAPPARRPMRPVTGGQINGAARETPPESTLDVIRRVRGR